MNRIQIIIVVSLLSTALLSWLVSAIKQDEIMNGMMIPQIYNPMLISLFTASLTGGMAVMMFPAIVPMILLYSRLIENKQTASNNTFSTATYSTYNILHFLKILIFVSMYLNVWTTTGIGLILGCSVSVRNVPRIQEHKNVSIVFGSILIVSGIYQFSSFKNKCLGYCGSPIKLLYEMMEKQKNWRIKDGYLSWSLLSWVLLAFFLIMVALDWMNIGWMTLFSLIILGEKMWSRSIWISRLVVMALIIVGIFSIVGVISPYNGNMSMTTNSSI